MDWYVMLFLPLPLDAYILPPRFRPFDGLSALGPVLSSVYALARAVTQPPCHSAEATAVSRLSQRLACIMMGAATHSQFIPGHTRMAYYYPSHYISQGSDSFDLAAPRPCKAALRRFPLLTRL